MDGRIEILMREYETITQQIIHWDSHFWQKSQFFLALETFVFMAVGYIASKPILEQKTINDLFFFVLLGIAVLNVLVCYIWFRTNRRNREYLNVRFKRALEIEEDSELQGILNLYKSQLTELTSDSQEKHSSSWWEIHLPNLLIIAWASLLFGLSAFYSVYFHLFVTMFVAIIFSVVFIIFERTGWPAFNRKKKVIQ